ALLVTGLGGPTIHRLLLPGLALETAAMDRRMLGLAALCMVGTALVTGLVPVLQAGRRTITALRDGAQHGTARRSPLHRALLVTQTALSVTLLIGAGLFLRSLHEVAELDLGLDTEHVLAVSIDFAGTGRSAREVGA